MNAVLEAPAHATLAAVDLGSNSFRLEIGRVVGHQLYPVDSLREPVRLAAGLRPDKHLEPAAQERALATLERFGERLRGFPRSAVRAIATNTFRVARNAKALLAAAEARLGYPIEVISGHEEARLIYVGVAHLLAPGDDRRLVVDIGGGSTELIIGHGQTPELLESVYIGCVSFSQKHFADGRWTKAGFRQAEFAARHELEVHSRAYRSHGWVEAIGSSGTARALADLLEANGYSSYGITLDGLMSLRAAMLKAGSPEALGIAGLKDDRIPVLAGGLAIMTAVFEEFGIERMAVSAGALRTGVLYDLLGRSSAEDMRETTVRVFMQRYQVDAAQARRVADTAQRLWESSSVRGADPDLTFAETGDSARHVLDWAARLHEIGRQVSHNGYHKHSTYILANADMPGFSRREQDALAALALGHLGKLGKVRDQVRGRDDFRMIACLRLAAVLHRSRAEVELPATPLVVAGGEFRLHLHRASLEANPLTGFDLAQEIEEWRRAGQRLRIVTR